MNLLPWLLLAVGRGDLCLPDGIPEADREFLQRSTGELDAIQLLAFEWSSAELVSIIARIVVEEVLGYRASISDLRPLAVLDAALPLSGCKNTNCSELSPEVGHIALETWIGAYGAEFQIFRENHPSQVPEDLGTMGYSGEEAMYVSQDVLQEAYGATGHTLQFYMSYNTSNYDAKKHFDKLTDLPAEDIAFCNETGRLWTDTTAMNPYAQWTGDLDGLVEVPGGYHAKCPDGRFWISPACRHNTSKCIPVVSNRLGWLVDTFMFWSAAYGMPTAIGISLSVQLHIDHFTNHRSLTYWYRPDVRFAHLDPQPIIFPRHRASEWAQGNKRTMTQGSYIGKLVARELRFQAFNVYEFVKNMEFDLSEVQTQLMKVATENQSLEVVACHWVLSNSQRWRNWLRKDTSCFPGYGLVDARGSFVSSRAAAVSCNFCSSGTASRSLVDDAGQTYTCDSCPAGTYQSASGGTACLDCEPGRVGAANGLTACEVCTLGSYANTSGMTQCKQCGSGGEEWTTSRVALGQERWLEVEGATDESFCHCRSGLFLHDGACQVCSDGTKCTGSDQLQLLPGFFSSPEDPGSVFRCESVEACPGGSPGTCAAGREVSSVACGICLEGLRPSGETCEPCGGGDYVFLVFIVLAIFLSTGWLHAWFLYQAKHHIVRQGALLNVTMYITQLVVYLQLLVVIQKIEVNWGEPFLLILDWLSFLSLEELVKSLHAISCVARLTPTLQFLLQTIAVPAAFMVAPTCTHLFLQTPCALRKRRIGSSKFYVLLETLGSLSVLFFIVLCTAVVEPLQCQEHPNGMSTLQSSVSVFCNFTGVHLHLCIIGGILGLLPLAFLSLCAWAVLCELPRRVQMADMKFIVAFSFLVLRFSPGLEPFAIFLLLRNMLFALAPVLPSASASLLLVHVLICANFFVVALFKPWRTLHASYSDILANMIFLIIIFQASFFVSEVDKVASMVLCTAALCAILLGLTGLSFYTMMKLLLSRNGSKRYRYFLSHQKSAAGCLARLLKIELQVRGLSSFLDADDLTDLSWLFSVLSQNVEALVVIATPMYLTRTWCVAELVTARLHQLETTLLALPHFFIPSDAFIDEFESMAQSKIDLATWGFGTADITETIRWLRTLRFFTLQSPLGRSQITDVVNFLTGTSRPSSEVVDSDCLILADQDSVEAVATAHILRHFMAPHVLHLCNVLPKVLGATDKIKRTTQSLDTSNVSYRPLLLVMVCTHGCLVSGHMVDWVLQAYRVASSCNVLPVTAEDGFQIPPPAVLTELQRHPKVQAARDYNAAATYVKVLKAIFVQVAVHFLPQSFSESSLELKAKQVASRLQREHSANLSSLLDMSATGSETLRTFSSGEPTAPLRALSVDSGVGEMLAMMQTTTENSQEDYVEQAF
ncbi:unnamed protein product [Symbiodinium sp. CCMP2592]|nr:unnamed protein product [Symbiodinium sp. CCMP2592]